MKKLLFFCIFALFAMCQQMAFGQDRSMYDFPNSAPSFAMRANTMATSKSTAAACFTTTRTSYTTGSSPQGIDAGDLDNDGDKDLVTGNTSTANVSVLMNQGDGTFAAKVDYAAAASTISVTIADLNKDGFKDIVAVGSGGSVKILLNSGTGTFTAGASLTFSISNEAKVGDVNADGNPDLLITNNGTVSVLVGNGDGTFAAAVTYTIGSSSVGIVLKDFDADGDLDIATANFGSGTISVLLGTGTGTFGTHVTYAVNTQPQGLVSGDFDSDGDFDLATNNFGSNNASVLLGNGNGTFATKTNYTVGSAPRFTGLGDMNADGKLDLAVTNRDSNTYSLLLGNGDGTFAADCQIATSNQPRAIAVADFNGDGVDDVATTNYAVNTVDIHLSEPAIAATTTAATAVTSTGATLNGTINPNGFTVGSAHFRISSIYTTLSTYSSISVNVSGIGTGTSAVPFSTVQTGLDPNTTYYYQMVACEPAPTAALGRAVQGGSNLKTRDGSKSLAGSALTCYKGAIMSFTTPAPPTIAVTTNAATSVTSTSATLNGTINPNGLYVSSATFRYGTSPTLSAYSTATVDVSGIGTGNSRVPVSANLTGLTPNTTYYFRLTGLEGGCGEAGSCDLNKAVEGNIVGSNLKTGGGIKSLSMIDPSVKGEILSFSTVVVATPPTAINLSNSSFGEFSPVGALIGNLSTTDADAGDTFTYALVPGECGADNAMVKIVGNQLQVNQADISYNQKQALNVQIRTTDSQSHTLTQCKVLQVQNVNFAPIFLSQAVAEGQDCSPFKHSIYVADRDAEDTFTFSLVDAPSWVKLAVNGSSVELTGTPLQAQVGTYTFKILVKSGNDTVEQAVTVKIKDVNNPPVFTSEMPSLGTELHKGNKFVADFSATDCDGDLLTLKPMSDLPTWITPSSGNKIEATKGPVSASFMGNATELGYYALTVVASDGKLEAKQSFNVHVAERWLPLVASTPPESVDLGKEFRYELKASSEDGDPVLFLVMAAPSWATFSCDGSATTPTGGTQDRCVGSKKSVFAGTPKAENLPAKFKVMILDDVIYNPSRSCQEFTLALEGAKVVVKDFKRTNCGTEVLANAEMETPQITKALAEIPQEFALLGNYPNPFNPSTAVVFNLPESAEVTLHVFNTLGQRVKSVIGQSFGAGANQRIELAMSDLGSGLYVYQLTAKGANNTFNATGRMTLVK